MHLVEADSLDTAGGHEGTLISHAATLLSGGRRGEKGFAEEEEDQRDNNDRGAVKLLRVMGSGQPITEMQQAQETNFLH